MAIAPNRPANPDARRLPGPLDSIMKREEINRTRYWNAGSLKAPQRDRRKNGSRA